MQSTMPTVDLEHIAKLDSAAFLHILQSILQSNTGKYSPNAHIWMHSHEFASLSIGDKVQDDKALGNMAQVLMNMFNLHEPLPSLNENFASYADHMYTKWRQGDQHITFFTSGSTGKPKPCTHPESHLRQELIGIVPLFPQRKAALVTAPLHHLFGFTFGLLLPLSLGIPLRLESPIPTVIAHQIQEYDIVIGVPLLYNSMTRIENLAHKKAFLLTGTAPFPPETFAFLLEKGFQMIEFFGSSEMGVMCYRPRPKIPFTLLPQFERVQDGKDIHDAVRRTLPDLRTQDFPLQDTIHWEDDRHLLPQGRKDSAVQVGGVNVFPEYVAKVLGEHPCVKLCAVRLMRKEEGHQLKAFIVLNDGFTPDTARKELRTYSRQKLKHVEQPAQLTFGDDIPRSAIGKPCDW